MIILLLFSALAGVVTVLSPCILPVLPLLLAVGAGQGRLRPLGIIVGLVLSFSFFTLSLTALVHATGLSPDVLRYAAIALIIFSGLTLLFPKLGDWFAAKTSRLAQVGTTVQEQSVHVGTGFVSGFVVGTALGLLWTPCAGPILATITTLVATHAVTLESVLVTFAYSIGAAVPMLMIMIGGSAAINSTHILAQYSEIIRKVFGLLMIIGALAIAFHGDVWLQQLTARYFPSINVENNELVRKQLANLRSDLPSTDNIHAPELVGIKDWINSQPLTLKELRGKVVLVDFWTYSCINCVRTLPHLKKWWDTYQDKGLVIVGVHTPEFEFEKSLSNVQNAVKRFGITYPVGLDSDYKTWQAYDNHYWPAHYLVDQQGIIRDAVFGEGAYLKTENNIRKLLGLAPLDEEEEMRVSQPMTPETYLGWGRGRSYINKIKQDETAEYGYQSALAANYIGLKGQWFVGPQSIQSKGNNCTLDLNFAGSQVYLVMQSPEPHLITVLLDGKPVPQKYYSTDMNKDGKIAVHEPRMHEIIDLKGDYGRHLLTLQLPAEVNLYSFAFGAGDR
jgi:cytochrome c biogenesis protein CcdA/thiol-disulfide isomerase/thioredoxin